MPLSAVAISIAIHTLWGANPVAVKLSLEVFPPLWTGFFRFVIGSLCVCAFAWATGARLWPKREEWPSLLFLAALFTVQIALMNIGYGATTASMGAILIATNPLFAAVVAHFHLSDDRLDARRAIGLAIAFAGTALVLTRGAGVDALHFQGWGNWVVLASAMLLGSRLIVSAGLLRRIDELRVTVWQMVLSLPVFAAGGLAFETIAWERLGPGPILGLLYQGVVIAGIGFTVSFYLMKRYTPSVIVSFNFVSPIAGVLLGAWLLEESLGLWLLAGLASVALGLYAIARRPA